MIKIRWLKVNWPTGLESVSSTLSRHQYTNENKRGFLLSQSTKLKIEGKYVEKQVHKKICIDPFGQERETLFPIHYCVDFTTLHTSSLLEVRAPPTSIRPFLSELHKQFGLGLMVADISVDPLKWVQQVEHTVSNVVVTKIDALGLCIAKGSAGQICIHGDKDVRGDFRKFLGGRTVSINAVSFSCVIRGNSITGQLKKNGTLKVDANNEAESVEVIRDCLETAIGDRALHTRAN